MKADQLNNCLKRLADPNKHQDMLAEFAPIMRLDSLVEANYEVAGYAEGNKNVDWLIRSDETSILLEVKKRATVLIRSLDRFQKGERDPDGTVPAPSHDVSLLFRSVESKFSSRSPSEIIQAAWIVTYVKQEEAELQAAFAKLDASRIHLAIIGDGEEDVHFSA